MWNSRLLARCGCRRLGGGARRATAKDGGAWSSSRHAGGASTGPAMSKGGWSRLLPGILAASTSTTGAASAARTIVVCPPTALAEPAAAVRGGSCWRLACRLERRLCSWLSGRSSRGSCASAPDRPPTMHRRPKDKIGLRTKGRPQHEIKAVPAQVMPCVRRPRPSRPSRYLDNFP